MMTGLAQPCSAAATQALPPHWHSDSLSSLAPKFMARVRQVLRTATATTSVIDTLSTCTSACHYVHPDVSREHVLSEQAHAVHARNT